MAGILVIDDCPDTRSTLTTFLEAAGHEVATAPNGREALPSVLAQLPDVVLLNMLMPEMDGPSFLEVLRSYLRLQSLPVVVYTGLEDGPMLRRARALDVTAILVKGQASPNDLLSALEEAVAG